MPEYSVEAESSLEGFENYINDSIDLINFLGEEKLPFIAIKCTGLMDINLLEKISSGELSYEGEEYLTFKSRMIQLCDAGLKNNVQILIDAEETWIQDAIDNLALELMKKYNVKSPMISLTHQCYRTGTLEKIKRNLKSVKEGGYYYGVKLVRGAYMEKERERAIKNGYPSPIQPTKELTDKEFNDSLKYTIENIDYSSLWVGSHNENSCEYLMELMRKIISNQMIIGYGSLNYLE